ncbi:hypothetical protein Taro_001705 [Colocasia esculenta]|uniref:Uncharacterized protein n=1 Tax=Colocasia esculenta TaxID=4460 RepID=A0A843TIU5_COLES|nr:hypothetical protein [Colocasia esculenta]
MAMVDVARQDPLVSSGDKKDIVRPRVEYHPSVWGDYFIHFRNLDNLFLLFTSNFQSVSEGEINCLLTYHN